MRKLDPEQFEQIVNRLDTLIKLTVISAFRDSSKVDIVRVLSDLGFSNKDIASILGSTPGYVANVRSALKKQKTKNKDEATNE